MPEIDFDFVCPLKLFRGTEQDSSDESGQYAQASLEYLRPGIRDAAEKVVRQCCYRCGLILTANETGAINATSDGDCQQVMRFRGIKSGDQLAQLGPEAVDLLKAYLH